MRIGILETGRPPEEFAGIVPAYPQMIRAALGRIGTYRQFDVVGGELPDPQRDADAYVITGSDSSAYDSDEWIGRLCDWLRSVGRQTPIAGICFGHQVMARAYGGKVARSVEGWVGGLREYTVCARERWMDEVSNFVLPAAHYDQVVEAPATAKVIAGSDYCPFAALSYVDRRAVSFQAHPEFSLDYAALLIRRSEHVGLMDRAAAEQAQRSLRQSHDCVRVAGWIRRFFRIEVS